MLKTMGRVATAGALALALTTSFALAGCSQSDDAATEPAATQGSAAQESTEVDAEKKQNRAGRVCGI